MVKKGADDIKVVMDKYLGHMIMCLDKGLFTNYVAIHGGRGNCQMSILHYKPHRVKVAIKKLAMWFWCFALCFFETLFSRSRLGFSFTQLFHYPKIRITGILVFYYSKI